MSEQARRLLTEAVCAELEHLQHILEGARRPGYRFHFVEAAPSEGLAFAGPALRGWPENNRMQRTAHAETQRRP